MDDEHDPFYLKGYGVWDLWKFCSSPANNLAFFMLVLIFFNVDLYQMPLLVLGEAYLEKALLLPRPHQLANINCKLISFLTWPRHEGSMANCLFHILRKLGMSKLLVVPLSSGGQMPSQITLLARSIAVGARQPHAYWNHPLRPLHVNSFHIWLDF